MKVLHLSYSDGDGGAGLGARRLHRAMLKHGVHSEMLLARADDTEGVVTLAEVGLRKAYSRVFHRQLRAKRWFGSARPMAIRSINIFDYGIARVVNDWSCDIVQMHWVGNGFMPIRELAEIRKPIFWKLPDMWAFSGAEHYREDVAAERHINGYGPAGRVPGIPFWGRDMDAVTWRHKLKHWSDLPLTVIAPSRWLGREAYMSRLFRDYDVHVIPNPLDAQLFAPLSPAERGAKRRQLGWPLDRHVMAFAAFVTEDPRKGYRHLESAIRSHLPKLVSPELLSFAVIGGSTLGSSNVGPYQVTHIGQISSQRDYAQALAAADSFVLPAEIDNLPNTVAEAMSCGLPAVAFNVGGLPDLIDHHETGYLASPFDQRDLARGIAWALRYEGSELVRRRAMRFSDETTAVQRYLRVYDDVLEKSANAGLSAIRPSARDGAGQEPTLDTRTFPSNPTQSPSLNDHSIIAARKGKGRFHDLRFEELAAVSSRPAAAAENRRRRVIHPT